MACLPRFAVSGLVVVTTKRDNAWQPCPKLYPGQEAAEALRIMSDAGCELSMMAVI